MKKQSIKGGKRPGAGRKKGSVSQKTLDKLAVIREYKNRVAHHANQLFDAQFSNAIGNTYVYEVIEHRTKDKTWKEHVLVTSQQQIKAVLDAHHGDSGTVDNQYFIVTTEKPDNRAIDAMLDRAFGKAVNTIVTEDEAGNKKPIGTITIE